VALPLLEELKMAVTALRGIDVGEVVSGFNVLSQSFDNIRRFKIAEAELAENTRLSRARSGVLETENIFNAARNAQLKKDLAGDDEGRKTAAVDLLYGGSITRGLKQQLFTAQQENQFIQTQMRVMDTVRKQQEQVRKGIESEVDAVYASGLPADEAVPTARSLKQSLTAIAQGNFNPEIMETPADIYVGMREGVRQERDRLLKETEAKEKRAEVAKTGEIRERAVEWPPKDKSMYEYGSFLEADLAVKNRQDQPELRYVEYDPLGWGVGRVKKDITGVAVPSKYQRKGMKLMTERRAMALGVHDEWLKSGQPITSTPGQPPTKVNLKDLNL